MAERADELLAVLELDGDAERTLIIDYSTGMRKKIGLATALLHAPRLLVLDEPFEAVDPVSAATLKAILRGFVAGGGSVLLSSHVMALVEQLCDTVAVMAKGSVVAEGPLDEVRGDRTLEESFVALVGADVAAGDGPVVVGVLISMKLAVMRRAATRPARELHARRRRARPRRRRRDDRRRDARARRHGDAHGPAGGDVRGLGARLDAGTRLRRPAGAAAEHFALAPDPAPPARRRPARSTAFVGITAASRSIAFARDGRVRGAPGRGARASSRCRAWSLQLALVIVLSRLAAELFAALSRSRVGGAISALITAALLVLASSGWIVFVAIDTVLAPGSPASSRSRVRALPSSWALLAVEAASRSDWAMAALRWRALRCWWRCWCWLWGAVARAAVGCAARSCAGPRAGGPAPWPGAVAAVLVKELPSWWRDPVRMQSRGRRAGVRGADLPVPLFFDSTHVPRLRRARSPR